MSTTHRSKTLLFASVAAVAAAAATAAVTALLVNINERKHEARVTAVKLVDVGEDDVDPKLWAANFPRQYDGYRRTAEVTTTTFGGGLIGSQGALPPQKAERDPWLTRVFAGYLFAVDYRDRRGHAFMLADQEVTKRNVPGEGEQSGNCLHCHSSIMPLYRKLGREALPTGSPAEQVQKGLERVGALDYWDAHKALGELTKGAHPVSCVDCHDPKSMELRVTRPGFLAGIQQLAASDAEVPHLPSILSWRKGARRQPYDPNVDGTRQELRSFVCGQCHVEYFCGKGMTIFFPWSKGLKVEQMESQYDGMEVKGKTFKDWTHAETGFDVLKAQHPEFELWSQGVHARSGVACADCHMPYKREGALKVSDHWVRSPLLNLNRACETCHPYGEAELKARVETIQERHFKLMSRAGSAAVAMIDAIKPLRAAHDAARRDALLQEARAAATQPVDEAKLAADLKARLLASWQARVAADPKLAEVAKLQRAAQWRLDFVAAENSMGFHAPQEMARILGESIDLSRQAQVLAVSLGASTSAAGSLTAPALGPPAEAPAGGDAPKSP